jgi:hypothetical protein
VGAGEAGVPPSFSLVSDAVLLLPLVKKIQD